MSFTFLGETWFPRQYRRRCKCTDCGNLFLINTRPKHNNYTTEYDSFGKRYWGRWKGNYVQAFIPLRSTCCGARMAPTRIAIGNVIEGVIE